MATLDDLERDAARLGMLSIADGSPLPGGGEYASVDEDPLEDVDRQRRRFQAETERNAAMEEIEEERETRRLRRQAERLKYQRQLAEAEGAGRRDDGEAMANVVQSLMERMTDDRRELMDQIKDLKAQNEGTATKQMMTLLQGVQDQINALRTQGLGGPAPDPIAQLTDGISKIATVRELVDKLAPSQAAQVNLSRQQMIDQQNAQLEARIRGIDAEARLEEARAKREGVHAEHEAKLHRTDKLTGMVEGALKQFAPALIGGVGEAAGGGSGELTFNCPSCAAPLTAPVGTTFTACTSCLAAFSLSPPS